MRSDLWVNIPVVEKEERASMSYSWIITIQSSVETILYLSLSFPSLPSLRHNNGTQTPVKSGCDSHPGPACEVDRHSLRKLLFCLILGATSSPAISFKTELLYRSPPTKPPNLNLCLWPSIFLRERNKCAQGLCFDSYHCHKMRSNLFIFSVPRQASHPFTFSLKQRDGLCLDTVW